MNIGFTIALFLILCGGGICLSPHRACALVARLKRAFRHYLIKRYGEHYATDFLGKPTLLEEAF